MRAQNTVTARDLKVLSVFLFYEVVSRRIHKLVQVIFLSFPVVAQYVRLENFYITFFHVSFKC